MIIEIHDKYIIIHFIKKIKKLEIISRNSNLIRKKNMQIIQTSIFYSVKYFSK